MARQATLKRTTDEDGVTIECTCGWSHYECEYDINYRERPWTELRAALYAAFDKHHCW